MTASQENAIRSAESYLELSGFSEQGLIDQLSSDYGDGYPRKDSVFAVRHLDVDWNAEAVESAKSYLELSGFSRQGLIDQLSSSNDDGALVLVGGSLLGGASLTTCCTRSKYCLAWSACPAF